MPDSTEPATAPPRRGARRRLAAGLGFIVAVAFPLALSAPANADTQPTPDPLGNLVGVVKGTVDTATQALTPKAPTSPSSPAGSGTSHASSSTAGVTSHQHKVVEVSGNHVGTDSQDKPRAKADLVAVGGHTVIGSQSSNGTGHSPVPGNPLCASTGGALCVSALTADSSADGSSAATATGLLAACLGGDDATGASCSGQQVGLAQGQAHEGPDGSSSSAALADVCLRLGADCGLSLDALSSASGSGATQPDLATLGLPGATVALPRDTADLDVPTGCAAPGVLCAVLNDVDRSGSGDSRDAAGVDVLEQLLGATAGSSSSDTPQAPPAPTTMNPQDGATAQLVDLGLTSPDGAHQPLLGLSQNTTGDDGQQAQADGTLLSVAGHEVIGSHSTSPGSTLTQGVLPANPLCSATTGALCADLLYADSDADHQATGADANSSTGVLSFCLIGDDPTGHRCSGLSVGVAQGESHLHRGADGTQSSAATSLADVCLAGSTGCALSGDVLESHGSADSAGEHDSGGTIAGVGLGGTGVAAPSGDPVTGTVPGVCGENGLSILCTTLNQTQQGLGTAGGAGTSQTVAQLGLVDGTAGLTGAHTATGATVSSPTTGEPPAGTPPATAPGTTPHTTDVVSTPHGSTTGVHDATPTAASSASGLPNTGGPWLGALPLAGLLMLGGVVVLSRGKEGVR